MGKVRFGISISDELSRQLDELARKTGMSRSELVEQAIRNMIADYTHYLVPHDCSGIMIALCPEEKGSESVVEQYSDVASAYFHFHQGGNCLEILMVSGPSERITELHGRLASLGCGVRFMPSLSLAGFSSQRPPSPQYLGASTRDQALSL